MSHGRRNTIAALSLFAASAAIAGPIWCEPMPGDAGAVPTGANITRGTGPLFAIKGTLQGAPPRGIVGTADFHDVYRIRIVFPDKFVATTNPDFQNAGAAFNSRLFLFDADGRALLGNLNDPNGIPGAATIFPAADDGTGFVLDQPGIYLLAITGAPSLPLNAAGDQLFDFENPFEVSGPDGVPLGASDVLNQWSSPELTGEYRIALFGASFAEPLCPGDCNQDGEVNFNDLSCALFSFGEPFVEADCNADGAVHFNDLTCTLFNFGPCDQSN